MIGRDDLSTKLIHFTKGDYGAALINFRSILGQGLLLGGTGDIAGDFRCVCFTESPIAKFPHILSKPSLFQFPYAPLGIMIDKTWLFERGGRPVIYQPDTEYDLLSENMRWRHKAYDPKQGIDKTWEREWRIRMDQLSIDPAQATVIVPKRSYVAELQQEHSDQLRFAVSALGDSAMLYIEPYEWHFLALEDLGVQVDWPNNLSI